MRPRPGRIALAIALGLSSFGTAAVPAASPVPPAPVEETKWGFLLPSSIPAEHKRQLERTSKRLSNAVFLVGDPNIAWGTGFVISRSHRLLVTAAHVADGMARPGYRMVAMPNGSIRHYQVSQVWYHPNVTRRFLPDLYVRSPDPRFGPIRYGTPDIAVVQLAEGGPSLPVECTLATWDELRNLEGAWVGFLGFAGSRNPGWRVRRSSTLASFSWGESTGFTWYTGDRSDAPAERRQIAEFFSFIEDGESGCPAFLPNGHVVAVSKSATKEELLGVELPSVSADRVDSLRELLKFHELDRWVPFSKDDRPNEGAKTWPPYPRIQLADVRLARKMVRDASLLTDPSSFSPACALCDQAIRLVPGYIGAHLQKSRTDLRYLTMKWKSLALDEKERVTRDAVDHASRAFAADPLLNASILGLVHAYLFDERLRKDAKSMRDFVGFCTHQLGGVGEKPPFAAFERSYLLDCRAQAEQGLGDLAAALRDYTESIRLAPDQRNNFLNRAQLWMKIGRPEMAMIDYEEADRIAQSHTKRNATAPISAH